jgi:protoporphyrinogen oxidase
MGEAAVVGAGLLGLAVTHRLRDRGHNVTVFETAPDVGGLARSWEHDGIHWDRHCHLTIPSDLLAQQVIRRIGLDRELRWRDTSNAFLVPGQGVWACTNELDLLRLPTLGALDRMRVGATIRAGVRQTGARWRDRSAEELLTAWSGRRAFERFWLPLLRARLGDQWRNVSAAFVVSTIRSLYTSRHGVLRPAPRGFVPGGYSRIAQRYAGWLADLGVKINTGARVRRVQAADDRLQVELNGSSATFDHVVLTTSASVAADLCPGLTTDEVARLRTTPYVGVICASLLLPYGLSPHLTTYLDDPAAPFTSIVELTRLTGPREFGGRQVVYLPRYTAPDDPLFDAPDSELRSTFLEHLARVHPRLSIGDVEAFRVSRARHVFALPVVGPPPRPSSTLTSVPGLQVLGTGNPRFGTVSLNDSLSLLQDLH